jgi:hypothetical protein
MFKTKIGTLIIKAISSFLMLEKIYSDLIIFKKAADVSLKQRLFKVIFTAEA